MLLNHTHLTSAGPSGPMVGADFGSHTHLTAWGPSGPPIFSLGTLHYHLSGTAPLQPVSLVNRQIIQSLLPRGPAWPRDDDATLTALVVALAGELDRVEVRALNDLINETDPTTAYETLDEWQKMLALPDPTTPPGYFTSINQAINAKWSFQGGQSVPYYTQIAAALGYRTGGGGGSLAFSEPIWTTHMDCTSPCTNNCGNFQWAAVVDVTVAGHADNSVLEWLYNVVNAQAGLLFRFNYV